MGWGSWTVRLTAGLAVGGILTGAQVRAVVAAEPRQVLGTISVQGDVRVRDLAAANGVVAGEVVAKSGASLLENAVVTTGQKSAALLNLTADGMIGLRAGGAIEIGKRETDGFRATLLSGEILVRLPIASRMTLTTASAIIRPDALVPVSATPPPAAEASVKVLPDGQTIVRVETGSLHIEGARGGPTVVRAGEQATLAPDASPRLVVASTAPPTTKLAAPAGEQPKSGGIFKGDGDLALLLGVSAVVVGGTLGGLAATGQFDDNNDDSGKNGKAAAAVAPARAGQGSAFRASR